MLEFIGLGIFSYYIILLLVYENGPKNIFESFRKMLGVNQPILDADGALAGYESNNSMLANMISCHVCAGFWIGLIVGLLSGSGIIGTGVIIGLSVFMHEVS